MHNFSDFIFDLWTWECSLRNVIFENSWTLMVTWKCSFTNVIIWEWFDLWTLFHGHLRMVWPLNFFMVIWEWFDLWIPFHGHLRMKYTCILLNSITICLWVWNSVKFYSHLPMLFFDNNVLNGLLYSATCWINLSCPDSKTPGRRNVLLYSSGWLCKL